MKAPSTKNFNLGEFACKGSKRLLPPKSVWGNIQTLMTNLQVLRDELNAPITVTSGFRTKAHNKKVNGSPKSQHLLGKAADIQVKGYTPLQVRDTIEKLIASGKMTEGGLGLYDSFVHFDFRGIKSRWDQTSK